MKTSEKAYIIRDDIERVKAVLVGPENADMLALNAAFSDSCLEIEDGEILDAFIVYLIRNCGFRRPGVDCVDYEFAIVPDISNRHCVCRGPWVLKSVRKWSKRNETVWMMSRQIAEDMALEFGGEVVSASKVLLREQDRLTDLATQGVVEIPTEHRLKDDVHPLEAALEDLK